MACLSICGLSELSRPVTTPSADQQSWEAIITALSTLECLSLGACGYISMPLKFSDTGYVQAFESMVEVMFVNPKKRVNQEAHGI
jgi:hypothetical protein